MKTRMHRAYLTAVGIFVTSLVVSALIMLAPSLAHADCLWVIGSPPPCAYSQPESAQAIMIWQNQQQIQQAALQARQDQMEADQRAQQQYQEQHRYDTQVPDNNPSIYGTQVYGGRY